MGVTLRDDRGEKEEYNGEAEQRSIKDREDENKRRGERLHEKKKQKEQHRAFPRGPPPQYYPGSNLLNFAVRMGSGEPG